MPSRIVCFAILAAFLIPAAGQTLYKYKTPDGRTVYSDKPPPDGIKAQESTLDTSKQGIVPPSAREKAALKQMESDRRQREFDVERLRKAEIALHDAEVALAMGKEPQAGERIGTVSGNQRLTDGYWERQKKLEEAVEAARRTLESLRAGGR